MIWRDMCMAMSAALRRVALRSGVDVHGHIYSSRRVPAGCRHLPGR
ncbi:MAG: hypothetical protein MZV63_13005 [Marinilabiliales bacterium]|nr:hypothetical protein [Marinilabiliales bacterium]